MGKEATAESDDDEMAFLWELVTYCQLVMKQDVSNKIFGTSIQCVMKQDICDNSYMLTLHDEALYQWQYFEYMLTLRYD